MIYLIAFILVISLHRIYIYYLNPKIDWFSDYSWVDATFFLLIVIGMFLVHPQVGQNMSTLFVLYLVIGMLMVYLGLHSAVPTFITRFTRSEYAINISIIRILGIAYIILLMAHLVYTLSARGLSLWNYLGSATMRHYQGPGYLSGESWLLRLSELFWIPALIWMQYYLEKRKRLKFACILVFLMLVLAIFNQERFAFVQLAMVPVFFIHYKFSRIKIWAIIIFFSLALMASLFFDLWRSRGFEGIFRGNLSFSYLKKRTEGDLNPVRWLHHVFELYEDDSLEYDYFKQYGYSLAGQFPRVLWPDKPITAFEPRYTEKIFSIKMGQGNPIRTFTVFGEGLAMLGLLGIVVNCFMFGYLYRLARELIGRQPTTLLAWYSLCFMFFPYFRGSTSSFMAFMLRSFIILIVLWPFIFRRVEETTSS